MNLAGNLPWLKYWWLIILGELPQLSTSSLAVGANRILCFGIEANGLKAARIGYTAGNNI
jgi:hypothetical protein